ncbi:2-oxo acid dehydrogenase subunit E2 [Christensenellaceae bacterium OttesenSCG-928-K19]|nr:2-oxo acid dehydrogenase subunit E2 [Christensenellaceae bacterium OttesenSCG-928-K19]
MKRVMSTPAARRVAGEKRIDISGIKGTGQGGYVQLSDVLSYKGGKATFLAKAVADYMDINIGAIKKDGVIKKADVLEYKERMGQDQIIPLDGMRKTIATRMVESLQTAPQYTIMGEADAYKLLPFMKEYKARCMETIGIKPTFTDLFTKACAIALMKNPLLNSSFMGDHILLKGNVNIGLAVSLGEKGLIVPNIKNAHMLTLEQITESRSDLVGRALEGKLKPDEYTDGTFSISNYGRSAVQYFTPIINQPESAILGIGDTTNRVVPIDGGVGIRPMIGLSLTLDHRHVDGTTGEKFLADVKEILENPTMLED